MSANLSRRTFTLGTAGLGLVGALGLVGCSSQQGGGGGAEQGSGRLPAYIPYEGLTPDLPTTEDGLPAGFFAYPADPVQAFTEPPGDGDPVSAIVQTSEPIPPAVDNNPYWQELNARLGSDLQVAMTPAGDYASKFATIVAGDELPDVFQVARGANQVPQLLAAKALDLSPYLAGDAIADYPMLANIPTESWQHGMFDGKILAVPVPRGVLQSTIQYARADLLRELGITAAPTNFQEYFDLCKEVTAPTANTWALTSVPTNYIMQMLSVPNGWREEGGSLIHYSEVEEMPEALEAARTMYEAGVVVPDSFAVNGSQYKQWFMAGAALFTGDSYSAWPAYYAQSGGIEGFELAGLDMPGYDGGEGSIWVRSPTHSIVAVNQQSEARAEVILGIMNWLAAPFGTEEYRFRKYGVQDHNFTLDGSDPVRIEETTGETFLGIQYLADAPTALYLPGNAGVVQAQYEQMGRVIPGGSPDPTEALYSETKTRKYSGLTDVLNAVRDDIIQGRREVSDWAAEVETFKTNGGDTIRAELEEALAAQA
ncbi:extracellular solute-binding protein [Occultella aeris]|uniref:Lipoprotein LipO n=1 Tax=Occultella aeris TaxID=2761496 RepID=A0A7M4DGV3_9MICO|nr:extracellular solute-binding protein [Occultella aeris]VZO36146.1 Lipoprotein LipO precursor [Occultella aeris]